GPAFPVAAATHARHPAQNRALTFASVAALHNSFADHPWHPIRIAVQRPAADLALVLPAWSRIARINCIDRRTNSLSHTRQICAPNRRIIPAMETASDARCVALPIDRWTPPHGCQSPLSCGPARLLKT